ncbi:hypothetical protein, partial [Dyadobacter sp. LHD-138]|uniref:hypothetical protein n=1 Tax=Dyadobacter sp. LHD-138 TaxID=3071413 RepID=UPI0027E12B72
KSVPFHLTGCQGYFILPFQTIQTLRMKSRFNSPQEFGLIRRIEVLKTKLSSNVTAEKARNPATSM